MPESLVHTTHCPACGIECQVAEENLGILIQCLTCGGKFKYDEPLRQRKAKAKAQAKARRIIERDRNSELRAKSKTYNARITVAQRTERAIVLQRRETEKQIQIAEVAREDGQRLMHGSGCPKCGSVNIKQKSSTTGAGWGLIWGGIIFAFCTMGATLILTLIGVFLNETQSYCKSCGWTWRA